MSRFWLLLLATVLLAQPGWAQALAADEGGCHMRMEKACCCEPGPSCVCEAAPGGAATPAPLSARMEVAPLAAVVLYEVTSPAPAPAEDGRNGFAGVMASPVSKAVLHCTFRI